MQTHKGSRYIFTTSSGVPDSGSIPPRCFSSRGRHVNELIVREGGIREISVSKCGVSECINEPRGFVCVLGPSPASLIPARHIKETGDDIAARCLYMALPASSTLWWGESRPELGALDHIWPGVVSPAAILPASTACCQGTVAPLLPSCRLSLFSTISPPLLLLLPLLHHPRRAL